MTYGRSLLLLLATLLLAATATVAIAAKKNGITPKRPAAGQSIPSGKTTKFKMKVRGKGAVWVHVCKSRKRNAKGVICHDESIGQAKRKRKRLYIYKPRFFNYPSFWLNSPGRYYWQAHRIDCSVDIDDCLREGPVVKFRVR